MAPQDPFAACPRAPWGRAPISELCVALGLISALAGLATIGSDRGFWLLGPAMALALLAGLELAVRKHFSAHRRRGWAHAAPTLRPPDC